MKREYGRGGENHLSVMMEKIQEKTLKSANERGITGKEKKWSSWENEKMGGWRIAACMDRKKDSTYKQVTTVNLIKRPCGGGRGNFIRRVVEESDYGRTVTRGKKVCAESKAAARIKTGVREKRGEGGKTRNARVKNGAM